MPLIDWYHLATNALWIFALSLALSALGYAFWEAQGSPRRWRMVLQQEAYGRFSHLTGALFSLGVGLSLDTLWQQLLWGLLALIFLFGIVISPRNAD